MDDSVPFTDIYVDDVIIDRVEEVLESTRYVKGSELAEFEERFAERCGTDHAVGVSSGTAAILLGLQTAGIGEGDQVLVPGHTFFATVSPVLSLGAEPIFVDIDPNTYTMDVDDLRRKAAEATNPAAVIPVHIYGQMVEMDVLRTVADEHDLWIVEDSCQAHFAERNGDVAGAAGDVGAFSFYPTKNMTVAGDGGMLVTDNPDVAERARALRNHGRDSSGEHVELGLNYRLDDMNAVVGQEQLRHIDEWNRKRNENAQKYSERLSSVPEVVTPTEAPGGTHVYHLYVVQVPRRSELRSFLDDRGIGTGIHYETPAHEHEAVTERAGETTVEVTERISPRILSLPMHPRLTDEEISYVCDAIETFYQ